MFTKAFLLFALFFAISMATPSRLRGNLIDSPFQTDLNEEFPLEECDLVEFENELEWNLEENAEDTLVKENGKNCHSTLSLTIFRHRNEIYQMRAQV